MYGKNVRSDCAIADQLAGTQSTCMEAPLQYRSAT